MKTLNKIILTSLITAGSLGFIGKGYGQNPSHDEALKKYTPITKEQKESLFNKLNPGLKEYLNKIYIIDKKYFFEENIHGHVHSFGGIICLNQGYDINRKLFHEAGHVRHNALNKIGSDFSKNFRLTFGLNPA